MSQQDFLTQPIVIGDKIQWRYIQATAVLKYLDAIVQPEGNQSEQQVREAVLALFGTVPDGHRKRDKRLDEEMKTVWNEVDVDDRPTWCGKRIGEPKSHKEKQLDPTKLFHVCVNHLQRTGAIGKDIMTEKIVPTPEDFENPDVDEEEEESEESGVGKMNGSDS